MTVADYIANFLVAQGVRHVFGFQGSAMLKMLDAIMETGEIEYIQNFHEQASAFAADGYARLSGGIGVAIATSGPGASNLISGIANAYFDSIPVLFLTGQDRLAHVAVQNGARQNGFQDMDVVGLVRGITKYAVRLDDAAELSEVLGTAFRMALSGRKGPVLIDIPYDVQFMEVSAGIAPFLALPHQESDLTALDRIFALMRASIRPIVLVGGGVRLSGAGRELESFVRETGWPVVSTLNGLDASPSSLGFAGLYGNAQPNACIWDADLILALGVRFASQHVGKGRAEYAPRAKVIHVDIDESEFGRTDVDGEGERVKCDVGVFLRACLARGVAELSKSVAPVRAAHGQDAVVRFLQNVFSLFQSGDVIVADVGANQMWAAQAFEPCRGLRFLTSAGHGAMGYALPASVGASYAMDGAVICITGDGGFQMNLQELNTLSLHRRNVKILVLNNGVLGLMRAMQNRHFGGRLYGNGPMDFICPNLEALAECYRIPFARIAAEEDGARIANLLKTNGPALIDISVPASLCARTRYEGLPNA